MYNSKLTRTLQKIFGLESQPKQMVEFGSPTNGRAVYSKDAKDIQTDYYEAGWFPESLSGNIRPYAEDMNALHYVHSYQLAYLLQAGIPEWNAETPYFKDCIVRGVSNPNDSLDNTGRTLYVCQQNGVNGEGVIGTDPPKGLQPWLDYEGTFWTVLSLGETAVPVGASLEWNGMQVPSEKWRFENGDEVTNIQYPELYDVIGQTFGGWDETTTVDGETVTIHHFNLPNSTGKVMLGFKSGNDGYPIGMTGGQFNHQHFVPAHYHGLGNIAINPSGDHNHALRDNGHTHSLTPHQHKFRFGDYGVTTKTGGTRVAALGSSGTGSDNNPKQVGWDNGTGTTGAGHFMKMTSAGITNFSQDSSPAALLSTGLSSTGMVCEIAKHNHVHAAFTGSVGAINKANGDSGTMRTVSTNDATMDSNMPFIVKRKIIRVKP